MNYKPGYYSNEFATYLSHANVTPFGFYLTAQDVGVAQALDLVEKRIRDYDSE